jgi:hypothetical protein
MLEKYVTRQVRNGFVRADKDVYKHNSKKIAQGPTFVTIPTLTAI